MRRSVVVLTFVVAALVTVGVQRLSYGYFQSEELTKAQGRLSLYQASVIAELERFSHLTYVLARDPFVVATAEGADTGAMDVRFREFADQAGLDAIYLMTPDGLTISASNAGEPGSFVGQNYSFRPYFQSALDGQQGRFYGIGATTGLPGYFIADPVVGSSGDARGVIAIKLDLSKLQTSWRNSGENVLLANSDGVVLLSSDPSWLYRVLAPLTASQRTLIEATRQFPAQELLPLDFDIVGAGRVALDGEEHLHLESVDLPHGWQIHYFAADDRATALSLLVTATAVILAALALVFYQTQRTRRTTAALRRSEEEEAQLRQANERLAIEIDERKAAERRLKRTQDELERAGRLAALGRLSASVTHELGQPLTAMRNHLAADEISGSGNRGLAGKIGALVDRMEAITRQLKFFARSGTDDFDAFELNAAMDTSMSLLAPNIEQSGVEIDQRALDAPISVRGSRLRIEQVMTNVLRNAVEAVEDSPEKRIEIRIGQYDGVAWFEVADSGPGLGSATLSELQEPFVTTRESGQGMGLGLAISADIVRDHGGNMTTRESRLGGTVFRVEIPNSDAVEYDAA